VERRQILWIIYDRVETRLIASLRGLPIIKSYWKGKIMMKKNHIHKPNYTKKIIKEINYIKPGENDDLEWYDEGLDLLESNKIAEAELKFKELIVSQPESQDGYEGLALVYEKMGRKEEALYFIKEAINKAKKFLDDATIEELYKKTLKRIQKMN